MKAASPKPASVAVIGSGTPTIAIPPVRGVHRELLIEFFGKRLAYW
jgi:hypothetical protein